MSNVLRAFHSIIINFGISQKIVGGSISGCGVTGRGERYVSGYQCIDLIHYRSYCYRSCHGGLSTRASSRQYLEHSSECHLLWVDFGLATAVLQIVGIGAPPRRLWERIVWTRHGLSILSLYLESFGKTSGATQSCGRRWCCVIHRLCQLSCVSNTKFDAIDSRPTNKLNGGWTNGSESSSTPGFISFNHWGCYSTK